MTTTLQHYTNTLLETLLSIISIRDMCGVVLYE